MKNIAILGSTGSIGTQTLQVIDANPERFNVEVLTANNQVELLAQQARKFKPNMVVIGNESKYSACESIYDKEWYYQRRASYLFDATSRTGTD